MMLIGLGVLVMDQNIELLRSWGQSIARNITAQVISELQLTPFTESVEDYEQGLTNLWKKVCSGHLNKSDIYGLPDYVVEQLISKQIKQLQPLEKIAVYEAIARENNGISLNQSEMQALKYSNQSELDEDNVTTIMHCLDFVIDLVRAEVPVDWTTFKTNPYQLKDEIDFSRIFFNRENGVFVANAKLRRIANAFDLKNETGEKLEHLVLRNIGHKTLDIFCLKVIEELKIIPIPDDSEFSSQEANIETFWDELCLQSQGGRRSLLWETILEDMESTIYSLLLNQSVEEQFVMYMVAEALDELFEELADSRFSSSDEIKRMIDSVATVEFVRQKVFQAASVEKSSKVFSILE